MKLNKGIAIATAVFLAGALYADDFSDDFGDDSFGDDFGSSSASSSAVTINGTVSADARVYVDNDDVDEFDEIKDLSITTDPEAKLTFSYDGANTAAKATFKVNEDLLTENQANILDELSATAYVGDFVIAAGKMKEVWGKGDKLHVIDNFNANDYTDFIIPDYIDRRVAEPMARVTWNAPSGFSIEGVCTPTMTADQFDTDTDSAWCPYTYKTLVSTLESDMTTTLGEYAVAADSAAYDLYAAEDAYEAAKAKYEEDTSNTANAATYATAASTYSSAVEPYETALSNYLTYLSYASSFSADDILPDTDSLEYAQAGLRVTGTLGPVDLGASYYYGHYKTVSFDAISYDAGSDDYLNYDQKQTFGLEAAGVLSMFNLRSELAYNLTDDTDGDDYAVHNNSIAWLAGFDVDLPINNVNFNIQETGTYILNNDEITDSTYETYDVDYNSDDNYCINKIVVSLTDSFNHEKIKTELNGVWGIENEEFLIMPKVTVNVADDFDVALSGLYINSENKNGEFYGYDDNSYVQVAAKYTF
ncbi:MAG: hypothetical protein BKP49_03615 [Treponema sp. CETP13]|nr:MAG: hypothetical protein BKP49_03615 [Treponema sp. CETP13]